MLNLCVLRCGSKSYFKQFSGTVLLLLPQLFLLLVINMYS